MAGNGGQGMSDVRTQELLDRLVAPGQFPNMSCSEGHELYQGVTERIATLTRDLTTTSMQAEAEAIDLRTKYEAVKAELSAAREMIAGVSAPVSDEEEKSNQHHDDWGVACWYRSEIDLMLNIRRARHAIHQAC